MSLSRYCLMESSSSCPQTSETKSSPSKLHLSVTGLCQSENFRHDQAPKLWSVVTINVNKSFTRTKPAVDFIVMIDISASMKLDSKLLFVQATIEQLISKLEEHHRFSLIVFNHTITLLSELVYMTKHNKEVIKELLRSLQASGSTNISEALFTGIRLLNSRPAEEQKRISSVMLFTDGLSNRGLSSRETISSLNDLSIPENCVVNTFGYGSDHDSKMLHAIALKSKGVYYYIENKEAIPATFGECLAGILSTQAHNVIVKLKGLDGARIVTLATPYTIKEYQTAKEYDINLGLVYSGESKSILFKLSLRKMNEVLKVHNLVSVTVQYINTLTGITEQTTTSLSVSRTPSVCSEKIPLHLDQHINRYAAAVSITEAIELCKRNCFMEAQSKLDQVIKRIRNSDSAKLPYCEDLVKDLNECISGMRNQISFTTGIHIAYAYSVMYYMERSCGFKNISKKYNKDRNSGYGYLTQIQEEEAEKDENLISSYLSGNILSSSFA